MVSGDSRSPNVLGAAALADDGCTHRSIALGRVLLCTCVGVPAGGPNRNFSALWRNGLLVFPRIKAIPCRSSAAALPAQAASVSPVCSRAYSVDSHDEGVSDTDWSRSRMDCEYSALDVSRPCHM